MARGQSLYDWCLENGERGQQLLREFQGIDEYEIHYKPTEIARASGRKILWKCSKNHEWYTTVIQRTLRKSNCPKCSCHKVNIKNSLYTWCLQNGDYGQQLLQEFQGIDEYGTCYQPTELNKGTTKKLLWKCSKGHEWYATVYGRVCGYKCPQCYGNICIQGQNDLYTWCIQNGDYGQQILQEYRGIDEQGNYYVPNEIARASAKKLLWKCSKGHEWYATVFHRTLVKRGCPYCNVIGTSYPEQFLYRALLQIYPQTITRGKFQGIEYDITIPEEKTCIEYSGINWHVDKLDRDQMKADICKEHNVRFIQIYVHTGQIESDDIYDENQIIYKQSTDKDGHNQQLVKILDYIIKSFGHSVLEIGIEKAQTEAFNFMHGIESEGNKMTVIKDMNGNIVSDLDTLILRTPTDNIQADYTVEITIEDISKDGKTIRSNDNIGIIVKEPKFSIGQTVTVNTVLFISSYKPEGIKEEDFVDVGKIFYEV